MNLTRHSLGLSVALLVVCLLSAESVRSQTSSSILGKVRDRSGGVIPDATVTAIHLATRDNYTGVTDAQGDYRIDLRQVGRFELRIEMTGFKSAVFSNIVIEVGQAARLDATLEVGQLSETLTVETSSPVVRTETSSIGEVMDNRKILELPLKGREYIQLATLMPGVASRNPRSPSGTTQGATIEVNGQRGNANNYRLNGLSNVSAFDNTQAAAPPLDAVQEFQMVRNMYPVEFGRATGAVVDVRSRSGTNSLHGSVYEFNRNAALDARPYFATTKPGFTFNQYGGSVGGPIVLPYLYNGLDKTFFFFAFEGLKDRRSLTSKLGVPTAADRRGDFSQSVFTRPRDFRTGQLYPGGVIPESEWSPTGTTIINMLPEPNNAELPLNFISSVPQPIDQVRYVLRADQKIGRHSSFVSLNWGNQDQTRKHPVMENSDSTTFLDGGHLMGGYTHLFSARVLSETRIGYLYSFLGNQLLDRTNYPQQWGFPFVPRNPELFGAPRIDVNLGTGFQNLMGHSDAPYIRRDHGYNLVENVMITSGNHYLKVGFDVNNERYNSIAGWGSRGFHRPAGNYSGNPWADLLLGLSSRNWYNLDSRWVRLLRTEFAFYFQDDWKVHPRLTLNAGIRYDYNQAWKAREKYLTRFDFRTGQLVYAAGGVAEQEKPLLKFPARFDGPDTAYDPYKKDWGPRIGLAWRPWGGNKTVVRSGYGIFYVSPRGGDTHYNALAAPWLSYLAYTGTPQTPLYFDQVPVNIANGFYDNPGTVFPNDPNFRDASTQHWNFSIEREVARGLAVESSYVGNRSAHLSVGRSAHYFAERNIGLPTYPGFGSINFKANGFDAQYHSLQLKATQRYSLGLSYQASYTWGKALNNVSNNSGGLTFYNTDPAFDWGRSEQDARHIFSLAGIYELPFGRGRTYLANLHPVLNGVLGGWKLNYIFEGNTGYPFNLANGVYVRPDLLSGRDANLASSDRTLERWFDPTAFRNPRNDCPPIAGEQGFTTQCFGTLGRNVMDGPGYNRIDLGVSKVFTIRGEHRMELRGEFFNSMNHPNFYFNQFFIQFDAPGATKPNQVYEGRSVQIGLRYTF